MASAHTFPMALDRCYRNGFFEVPDPGSAGTVSVHSKGQAIVRVRTAGAEDRNIPAASAFGIGTRILVILEKDGGDLTVKFNTADTHVITTEGDAVELVVSNTDTGKVWAVLAQLISGLPADTSGFAKLELAKNGDGVDAALIYLTEQLLAAGVIDTALSQATK